MLSPKHPSEQHLRFFVDCYCFVFPFVLFCCFVFLLVWYLGYIIVFVLHCFMDMAGCGDMMMTWIPTNLHDELCNCPVAVNSVSKQSSSKACRIRNVYVCRRLCLVCLFVCLFVISINRQTLWHGSGFSVLCVLLQREWNSTGLSRLVINKKLQLSLWAC